MNDLQIFNNAEFGQVRTVTINDDPWFVGNDIATALGYADTKNAIKQHVDVEDKQIIQRGQNTTLEIPNRGLTVINESGLFSMIMGSELPTAKKFKHWVTSEVLPAIRKTGSYQKKLSDKDVMRIQLGMIDDHEDRIEKLENTMNIDYGQQKVLNGLISNAVITQLGGKQSPAYKEIGKKVFKECGKDYNDYFNVNARANTPRAKFNEAVEYIKNWKPSNNTQILIKDCNAQICM